MVNINQLINDPLLNKEIITYEIQNYSLSKFINKINPLNLNILHFNIRSLEKHLEELQVIIQNIDISTDIIVTTETWLKQFPENLKLDGYNEICSNNIYNNCDGILAYVRNYINIIKYKLKPIDHCNSLHSQYKYKNNIFCVALNIDHGIVIYCL